MAKMNFSDFNRLRTLVYQGDLCDDFEKRERLLTQIGAELRNPRLGLATTRELLDEIRARIEVDGIVHGGGSLDYSTVKGRPVHA